MDSNELQAAEPQGRTLNKYIFMRILIMTKIQSKAIYSYSSSMLRTQARGSINHEHSTRKIILEATHLPLPLAVLHLRTPQAVSFTIQRVNKQRSTSTARALNTSSEKIIATKVCVTWAA